MNRNILLVFIFILLLFTSCKTRGDADTLNYMQNIEQIAADVAVKNASATLQPGDQLIILVTAKDMDVVKPFNQNYSSAEAVQPTPSGGNTPTAGMQALSGPTYIIDAEGNVDFPTLGQINTTGKNLVELKDELRSRVSRYVINPTINVRLANFKVTVLGEVNRQGEYTVPGGKATILNALGLAGDLTMYGKRDNVLVVRNVDGQISKERMNLMDANFINSPYFNLKQGDVIYVSANENRQIAANQSPNTGLYISIASVALGVLGLLVTVLKN